MNAADQALLTWLNDQINTGKRTIAVPAELLKHTTSEGIEEAQRLAEISGCELEIE